MKYSLIASTICASLLVAGAAHAHGNVTPQPVDVEGLPDVEGWSDSNPYRQLEGKKRQKVIEKGDYAFHQTCAGCHGLEAKAGGIAPDLRMLTPKADDAYFVGRVQSGGRGMPAFGEVLEPEAVWAIRTWLETKHDEAMEERYGSP
ncbi:cytochrome c-550 PedF [Algiphilus aromaticivorans]|uniref:cytochrome c-550 PedF n=1 Tax=Algiphilus aromaticivorans TaxID=382454 RepID=UPI0005C17651|nr:cytochrome c-550 PedF [Algiphilus aromaticivorans]